MAEEEKKHTLIENDSTEYPISKKILIPILIILFLIAAGAPAYYFYSQFQKSQKLLTNPTDVAAEEIRMLTAEVGKVFELPQNETPTIASVADREKLKDQPFFANAQNGDKVLVYAQAKRAILYRPSTKKIIEIAPVNINQEGATNPNPTGTVAISSPAAQVNTGPTPTEVQFRFVIRNGTEITGLSRKFEPIIKGKVPGAIIARLENAQKQDFDKTLVIDLSEKRDIQTKTIAQLLEATVGILPEGETKPTDGDFLIILGKDKSGL